MKSLPTIVVCLAFLSIGIAQLHACNYQEIGMLYEGDLEQGVGKAVEDPPRGFTVEDTKLSMPKDGSPYWQGSVKITLPPAIENEQKYALKFVLETQLDDLNRSPAFQIGDPATSSADEIKQGLFNQEKTWYMYTTRPEHESELIEKGTMIDRVTVTVGDKFVKIGKHQLYNENLFPLDTLDTARNEVSIGMNQIINAKPGSDLHYGSGLRHVAVYALMCQA